MQIQRRTLNPTRQVPIIALLVVVAMVAAILVAAPRVLDVTRTAGSTEVQTDAQPLATGQSVTVPDAAIASQGEAGDKTVKEFRNDKEFSMFALTWQGDRDFGVFFRSQRADGSWSEWFDADPLDVPTDGTNGTEPIFVEPTHAVQVSMNNVDFNNPDSMNTMEVHFIDGGEGLAGDQSTIDLAAAQTGIPKVISRKGWGAGDKGCAVTYDDKVSAITIHHTAGSNNYTPAQAAGIVRGIWDYHANTLGWCDIGYNALVDKYGNIYEGRKGGFTKAVQGAHAGGFNQNTWGISMMGNYTSVNPSQDTIDAVGQLAGWRAAVAGFDPTGYDTHVSEGTRYSKFPMGQSVTLPNIFAHRDVGNTTCPGDAGYARMDEIRRIAKRNYDSLGGSAGGSNSNPLPAEPGGTGTGGTGSGGELGEAVEAVKALSNLSSGNNVTSDTSKAIVAIGAVGTILALVITFLTKNDMLPENLKNLSSKQLLPGLTLKDIPALGDKVANLSSGSNPERANAIRNLSSVMGKVLGAATGVVAYAAGTDTAFQTFQNGIILDNPRTGTQALWGKIGDAWAAQGFDAGALGLPVNQEHPDGNLIRVDFENGYITYDPATDQTQVHNN
ncbi:MAG: N-acetylmuramoyl-L-alanine amidase [Corynebacterium glucuronolyticum]|nr:N-acetylmuramoyl-L-alanine amidase [Corynebacterium glucuronolyticum]